MSEHEKNAIQKPPMHGHSKQTREGLTMMTCSCNRVENKNDQGLQAKVGRPKFIRDYNCREGSSE